MGGITAGTGIFSGMDTRSLIDQLMAIEGRPRLLAQRRIMQLQSQQAAYLDLNSKLSAMKTAASAFRINSVFKTNKAQSSKPEVLTATASINATPGQYTFLVDRMVTSQQLLSRGFASPTAGLNAGTFTFEPTAARLDTDTPLADLNGGSGISRGKIIISDSTGRSATVDLTRSATVGDVLEAINNAQAADVTARVEGGRFVITSNSGANLSITSSFGYETAASLGIETVAGASPTITGASVYSMGEHTAVRALNDGNGIYINTSETGANRFDFNIVVDHAGEFRTVRVNIGNMYGGSPPAITEAAPTTVGGILGRINAALETALGDSDMRAQVGADGVSLAIVDGQNRTFEVLENTNSTTAADLGIKTSAPVAGTLQGRRILAGLNTTLASTLNGGSGITSGTVSITGRDGNAYSVTVDGNSTVAEIMAAFAAQTGGKFKAQLNSNGTGMRITDATGGTGNLIIGGAAAESLGIATDPAGVAAAVFTGKNLQHQYVTRATLLSSLRSGQGVGTGTFRMRDSHGAGTDVTISDSIKTVDELIKHINSRGSRIRARVNGTGDGIEMYEEGTPGTQKIKIEDVSGAVAFNLNIKGEAPGLDDENVINGSYERKITFDPSDSLEKLVQKIGAANVGLLASIINDGSGSTPYRLSLTARNTGTAGRVIIDSGAFDLGLDQLDAGQDARVFFGASDPARAVLITSSRNTLDNVVTGVSIDLNSSHNDPVTLTVTRDQSAIESAVNLFIESFNTLMDRINSQTRYDKENEIRGPLLGDSTALTLQSSVFSTIMGKAQGLSGQFQRLTDVGISIGSGGKLTLDRERLRQAMEQDFQAVADLFTARELKPKEPATHSGGITVNNPDAPDEFLKLGVLGQVEELVNKYINTLNGTLTRRGKSLTDQIELQSKRIASIEARLANRRLVLERQFLAMEQAIGKLQSQQSALGSMSFI
jgi:flagellar hook-associated protein 2